MLYVFVYFVFKSAIKKCRLAGFNPNQGMLSMRLNTARPSSGRVDPAAISAIGGFAETAQLSVASAGIWPCPYSTVYSNLYQIM